MCILFIRMPMQIYSVTFMTPFISLMGDNLTRELEPITPA